MHCSLDCQALSVSEQHITKGKKENWAGFPHRKLVKTIIENVIKDIEGVTQLAVT